MGGLLSTGGGDLMGLKVKLNEAVEGVGGVEGPSCSGSLSDSPSDSWSRPAGLPSSVPKLSMVRRSFCRGDALPSSIDVSQCRSSHRFCTSWKCSGIGGALELISSALSGFAVEV